MTTAARLMPRPACESGYTRRQIEEIVGGRLREFDRWMLGQTAVLCEGRRWEMASKRYVPACNGVAHGKVYFPWDVERFLDRRPVID
jgi:hypothetical protein